MSGLHLNRRSWVWKLNVCTVDGLAVIFLNVGNKHVGERGVSLRRLDLLSLLGPAGDGHRSAIHVHFAVADLVEPRPCQAVVSRSNAFGNRVLEFCGTGASGVFSNISGSTGWAAADDGVDDHPFRVFGGLLVLGKRDLAGATAVGSTADE